MHTYTFSVFGTKFHPDSMSNFDAFRAKKSQNLSLSQNSRLGQKFLQHSIFPFINNLFKLQQQIWTCFCNFSWNADFLWRDKVVLSTTRRVRQELSTWYWNVTMYNLRSHLRRFIDTGYFSRVFGLVVVYGLLRQVSFGSFTFWLFASEKKDF